MGEPRRHDPAARTDSLRSALAPAVYKSSAIHKSSAAHKSPVVHEETGWAAFKSWAYENRGLIATGLATVGCVVPVAGQALCIGMQAAAFAIHIDQTISEQGLTASSATSIVIDGDMGLIPGGSLAKGFASVGGKQAVGAAAKTVANEGIYVVPSATGTYVGQSGNITRRLSQHVLKGKFTQAEVDAAERIHVGGGKTAREVSEQLKIDEFGGIDNLANKVNPIGARRFGLMPNQPYTR